MIGIWNSNALPLGKYLDTIPYHDYAPAPNKPGLLVRTDENGKRTVGRFVNHHFQSSRIRTLKLLLGKLAADLVKSSPAARWHVDIVSQVLDFQGGNMQLHQREVETQEDPSSLQQTMDRGTKTLRSVLSRMSRDDLRCLQRTVNEVDFLINVAQLGVLNGASLDPTESKLLAARVRGLHSVVRLRQSAEPTLESGEVCKLLGVTCETIRQKVNRRQLLALPKGGDRVFPAFQFKDGAVLNGLPAVLNALDTDSVFTILSFLLSQNPVYENKTAIEMLKAANIEPVVAEARTFLKHGA